MVRESNLFSPRFIARRDTDVRVPSPSQEKAARSFQLFSFAPFAGSLEELSVWQGMEGVAGWRLQAAAGGGRRSVAKEQAVSNPGHVFRIASVTEFRSDSLFACFGHISR
jgi:hypothetical protein